MAVSRRQVGVLLVALLGAIVLLAFSPEARSQPAEDDVDHGPGGAPYAAGELLVTYKEQASDAAVESLDEEVGAEVGETLPEIDARLFEFPEVKDEPSQGVRERDLEQIKEDLEKDPAVQSVGYNYLYSANGFPNDPGFLKQWGLSNTHFKNAWSTTLGSGTRIAIVDSGADVRHVDLKRNIARQWDFINRDGTVEDTFEHGTHVAGIAAAVTNNEEGIAGGCPSCKLLIAKVLDGNGLGTADDVAEGIMWGVDNGARVINLSLGDRGNARVVRDAVNYATRRGAVVVAAAGNDNTNRFEYPAAYPNVIAVAATTRDDLRAPFSNYGDWVDIAAPGGEDRASSSRRILSTIPGGTYYYMSGTSMAAPHVSALASLLASRGLGAADIKKRIFNTAVDLGRAGRDPYYGHGRMDAGRAL
jgi:thermitase